jgi:hypothetical protein
VRSSMAYHQARAQRLQEELERAQQALGRQERDTQIWQAQASKLMEAWTDSEARAEAATAAAAAAAGDAAVAADAAPPPQTKAMATSRDRGQQHRNPTRRRTRDRETKARPAWEPQGYSPPESSPHSAPSTAAPDRAAGDSATARLEAAAQREVALDAKAERLRQFERTLQRRESALCRREQDAEVAAAKLEEIAREIAMREQQLLASSRATATHQRAVGRPSTEREVVTSQPRRPASGQAMLKHGDRGCANHKRRLAASPAAMDHGRDLDCKRRPRVRDDMDPVRLERSPVGKPVGGTRGAQGSWRP